MFKLFRSTSVNTQRIRITPDPAQAAELERRRNALAYYPENGFISDRVAERILTQRKVK